LLKIQNEPEQVISYSQTSEPEQMNFYSVVAEKTYENRGNKKEKKDIHLMIKEYESRYHKSLQWKHKRIMVVDDEELCIEAVKAMMNLLKIDTEFAVDFCIDGREALEKL
jgi:PleD family two-component response regulator